LKGTKSGKAAISKLHANFILNTGGAKSDDVIRLIHLVHKKVKERFKIDLRPEIKIWK
jgi:UDP-N-acetylmuramate dehydrogenase